MKKLISLFLIISAFSCSTIKVAYDYDKQADFAKYKTYTISTETMQMTAVNQLNRDRIIAAAESQMVAKGFTKASVPASADVILDIRVKGKEVQTATATTSGGYGGYGRYRWGYGGGFSTTQVNYDSHTEGTMYVTLVDAATEKIAWQGTGTKTLSENANAQKREENIDYALSEIFKNYPPGTK